MVDKNLFLHDLAIVAIMKNEGPYLKEWLDYHLLAGVDHFYIYDNESPDNQAEVAKPYVAAGLVDYFHAPGKAMQCAAYNDAVKRFKFQARYMAFIDGDEFIYPTYRGGAISEVVDETLSRNPQAAGLAINWRLFGSNGQEKADYSRGVLERFTARDNKINHHVKTIANPRAVNFIANPHFTVYFEGLFSVNENGGAVPNYRNDLASDKKIIINHYHTKSLEEYRIKRTRGIATHISGPNYSDAQFESHDRNEEFDDGILKYRDERAKIYQPPDKSHANERLLTAFTANLSPTLIPTTPPNFYAGKMETFLTCRAVAAYLKTKLEDDTLAKFFEEASLKAIMRSFGGMSLADARLFLSELPDMLSLPYPVVKDIRHVAMNIIPQIMDIMRLNTMWKDYVELDYLRRLLQNFRE